MYFKNKKGLDVYDPYRISKIKLIFVRKFLLREAIKRVQTIRQVINLMEFNWWFMSEDQRETLEDLIDRLKPSLVQREKLYTLTGEAYWIRISPPYDFHFCIVMIKATSTLQGYCGKFVDGIFYRPVPDWNLIEEALALLPLKRGRHSLCVVLDDLLELYRFSKKEIVWQEIEKFSRNWDDWRKVYEATHEKSALLHLFKFSYKVSQWETIQKFVRPNHMTLFYRHYGTFLLQKGTTNPSHAI